MATSITTIFRADAEEPSQGSEKLHDLYWNRAELKKEFAALRNEKFELLERIKQHQGATARVQQKMNHLESLLLDREWVHNVVAFYQLRRLHAHCHAKLARFAEQLKQQREQRVHSRVLDSWNEARDADASRLEDAIGEQRLQTQLLEDQLQSQRHKVMTLGGMQKLLRGKALAAELDELAARIEASQEKERALLEKLDRNQNRPPPDHQGLDVSAKRSINFMILSFAQQLYLNFAEDNLAELAREASEKSVGAINYGSKPDCDEIIENLERRWAQLEKKAESPDALKQRAALLTENAEFRNDDDAVPVVHSVGVVYDVNANGLVREKDVNLLAENYFSIATLLSR